MENVRIDKGVKRGPRKTTNSIKARDPETGRCLQIIPKDLLPSTVIDRYLADERTADIAASYGIKRSRLNQWLLEHAEEDWRKAQVSRAVTAMENAKDALEVASDPLMLARAREQLRAAQWELERLFNRLFGQKQEVTINDNTDLGERLRRARERLIEGVSSTVPTNDAAQLSQRSTEITDAKVIVHDGKVDNNQQDVDS